MLNVSREGFSSSGEGLKLSQDAFMYVPAGILDQDEPVEPASPLANRKVTVQSQRTTDIEPTVLHERIRGFQGSASQLNKFCTTVPVQNSRGQLLRNSFFYDAVMLQGAKGKEFFPMCKGAFNEARKFGQISAFAIINYMKAAAAAGDYGEVKRAFDIAWDCNRYDLETFNCYMLLMGDRDFDQCRRGYFLALNSELADISTDNIWIFQNGKKGQADVALSTFKYIRDDSANAKTYAYILYIIGQMGDFEKAKEIFEEAKVKAAAGKIEMNEFIINNFMMIANKAGKYTEAIAAYNGTTIRSDNIGKSYQYAFNRKTGRKV